MPQIKQTISFSSVPLLLPQARQARRALPSVYACVLYAFPISANCWLLNAHCRRHVPTLAHQELSHPRSHLPVRTAAAAGDSKQVCGRFSATSREHKEFRVHPSRFESVLLQPIAHRTRHSILPDCLLEFKQAIRAGVSAPQAALATEDSPRVAELVEQFPWASFTFHEGIPHVHCAWCAAASDKSMAGDAPSSPCFQPLA